MHACLVINTNMNGLRAKISDNIWEQVMWHSKLSHPSRMPCSVSGCLESSPASASFQLPGIITGKQYLMDQVTGFLALRWETWMKFLHLDFGVAQIYKSVW